MFLVTKPSVAITTKCLCYYLPAEMLVLKANIIRRKFDGYDVAI